VIAAGAVAAVSWLSARESVERVEALAAQVASLERRLADEVGARAALEAETRTLRAALDAAQPAASPHVAAAAPAPTEDASGAAAAPDAGAEAPAAAAGGEPQPAALDADRLVAAGFRREDVERLRARTDQLDLERIYLRDRAIREGWLDTPRFAQETQAIDAERTGLRGEFDESLYDWMLFSTGQPNRVGVAEVLAGSAAESVGLAQGDVIVRYDDRLVMNVQDLLGATHEGRAGEPVAVEVQRAGERDPVRLFLPRGPIGVRISPVLMEPNGNG